METGKDNEYIKKIQGERIRLLMQKCHVSGKQLAEKLNYSPQHISYILNGKRTLTMDVAKAMADFFSKCLEHELNGDYIDYRYILGEADHMEFFTNFDPPLEKTVDHQFKAGIVALLHHWGYDLDVDFIPDMTTFLNIRPGSLESGWREHFFLDAQLTSKIVNRETGYCIEMLPAEAFQLFQDFAKAIISIVERKFEKKQWFDALNAPYTPPRPGNESPEPDPDVDVDDV